MDILNIGAAAFGLVIGWVTYRTLRRNASGAGLSDIASVIGAVGGAAVTGLFGNDQEFAAYSIGLAAGFFLYFVIGVALNGRANADSWMVTD